MPYTTDATRWRALATRDPNANGHFIYSVKSTKIYCRPTCPGRLARRANVGFYKTAPEAEAAGFRACKRCKPNTVLEDPQERAVEKACLLIDEALKNNTPKAFRLQDLAEKVGLTPRYFHKIFKDKTGVTPKEYAKVKKAEQSSPTSVPILSGSEASTSTPEWEVFDFNDLVDFGADPNPVLTDDFINGTVQGLTMGIGTEIDIASPSTISITIRSKRCRHHSKC
ncbi:metal binding domain of Ada-domain-containing protein [Pyrenochaeta sp. MPI-SDFR-AT-0127]|nr:metal binding domain of Ada-domain-containing protein [Pyrenochaeta sp. MPI-SDFR-AT-0127]